MDIVREILRIHEITNRDMIVNKICEHVFILTKLL